MPSRTRTTLIRNSERHIMKRLLVLSMAVAAMAIVGETANAQSYLDGYQFGAGLGARYGMCRNTIERQPYFAENPPVYYSHIVKRGYGVSPYPAPSGIAPIEMAAPAVVVPLSVKNPFFQPQIEQASGQDSDQPATDNKTTWIVNPHAHRGETVARR